MQPDTAKAVLSELKGAVSKLSLFLKTHEDGGDKSWGNLIAVYMHLLGLFDCYHEGKEDIFKKTPLLEYNESN